MRARSTVGLQVSGVAPFDPRSVSGLILNLDADDLSSLTLGGGNAVSEWRDKSGQGFGPLVQLSGANQPVWTAARQNGRAGLVFTRASNHFLAVNSALFTDFGQTIFVVAKSDSAAVAQAAFWVGDKDTLLNDATCYFRGDQVGDVLWYGIQDAGGGNACITPTGYTANQAHILIARSVSGSDRRITIDAGAEGTTTNARVMANFDQTVVGRRNRSTPSDAWSGDIYQILVYNRDLPAEQRAFVRRKLAEKWGLTGAAA